MYWSDPEQKVLISLGTCSGDLRPVGGCWMLLISLRDVSFKQYTFACIHTVVRIGTNRYGALSRHRYSTESTSSRRWPASLRTRSAPASGRVESVYCSTWACACVGYRGGTSDLCTV